MRSFLLGARARVAIMVAASVFSGSFAGGAAGQFKAEIAPELRAGIDQAAKDALTKTGAPGVSLAVVKDGQIIYAMAYGDARLEPEVAARSGMRHSIGSISKQFTAAAILMLAEEGKLSLDDPVSKHLPDLAHGRDVTIRQLLSHTSGYQDYWPQDYVPPFMLHAVTADNILNIWAKKPLDFEPGTKWQYSNTNYVIAGLIVEKLSGLTLLEFLTRGVFDPLGMQSVANFDQNGLSDTDATGYARHALGPLRVAPKEGKGWMFAAGELAMPATDLAKWDIGMMDEKLMKPESYREMETDTLLKNGLGTQYGLGVFVRSFENHRMLEHGGEVSGFTAENIVLPGDRAAVVVLTNQDAIGTASMIGRKVAGLLLQGDVKENHAKEQQTQQIFEDFQRGKIDRTLFSDNADSYFNDETVKDYMTGLSPLGAVEECTQLRHSLRGGMTFRAFQITAGKKTLTVTTYELPDGKLEQYLVEP
jgi:D-alanyl-D-alanine carboxypeptidase